MVLKYFKIMAKTTFYKNIDWFQKWECIRQSRKVFPTKSTRLQRLNELLFPMASTK